nr:MGMT family protein [Desulfobulbaceae bacterium]
MDDLKVTPFQEKVYQALKTVPKGKVTTYKYLAEAVGSNCPLAIGQALKRNPYAPEVPCHRVIKSDLSIGGYSGARSGDLVQKKKDLLQQEGVEFTGDFLRDCRCLYKPETFQLLRIS